MTALFVVLTFILFILADILVLKAQKKKHPAFAGAEDKAVFSKKTFAHPENIYVTKGHLWVKPLDENKVSIGIDDFITKALGKIKLVPLVKEGSSVNRGDVVFEGTGNSYKVSFRSPFKGIIKNINEPENLSIINNPFRSWVIELADNELTNSLKELKSGAALNKWIRNEFERLRDFLSMNSGKPEFAGVTMQDGGNVVEGILGMMDKDVIKAFEEQFLIS